jgi:hypothetical protein
MRQHSGSRGRAPFALLATHPDARLPAKSKSKRIEATRIRQIASRGKSPYRMAHTLKTMLLRKVRRNQILKAIVSASLNPSEFEFKNSDTEALLKHRWSKSYFVISGNAGHYVGRYVVGDGIDWPYEVYSWEAVMSRFSPWVKEVRDDLDTPDLWAELQRDAQLLGSVSGEANENTPFTSEEQKDLEQRLREVEAHVRETYSLTESDFNLLQKKIEYLVGAAGRLGRFDWLNTCAGVIFGYILAVGLPAETVRPFMTDLVHYLLEHGLPPLPLGG